VRAVGRFLSETEGWDERAARGWTASRRTACEKLVGRVLRSPEWVDRARTGLLGENARTFRNAVQVARDIGVDPFAALVARIEADPVRGPWYDAWQEVTRDRATALADLAVRLLPLDRIATGPAQEAGFGAAWAPHRALDWTLQELRHHPGIGAGLLLTGLRSPVMRNRTMALAALDAWPRAQWPDGAADQLARLAAEDPDDRTRTRATDLHTRRDHPARRASG
jgi:hypothetical protein